MTKELLEEIQIDNEDRWLLERYSWYRTRKGYLVATVGGKQVALHQVLCPVSDGMQVDHLDRNKLNFHKDNLRPATSQQQKMNTDKRDGIFTSAYKGVSWSKPLHRWKAGIKVNGHSRHLGYFFNEIDAAKAYNKAAKKWFKEFAVLNEIPQ